MVLKRFVHYLISSFVFLFITNGLYAQFETVDSINKVIFKKFSPPVSAVVEDMLYTQAQVFEAKDIYGKKYNLLEFRGKTVVVYFWNLDCDICIENLTKLDSIKTELGEKIEVFAFADEGKETLLSYFQQKNSDIHQMYKGKMLGEFMYGGSLGYPRLFLINKDGYIVRILPKEYFTNLKRFDNLEELILEYDR